MQSESRSALKTAHGFVNTIRGGKLCSIVEATPSEKCREETTATTSTLQRVQSEDIFRSPSQDTQDLDSRGTTFTGAFSSGGSRTRIGTALTPFSWQKTVAALNKKTLEEN